MTRDTGLQHAIVRGAVPRVIEFTGFVAAGIVSPIVGFVTLMSFSSLSLAWFLFAIVFGLAATAVSFVIVVRLFVMISERFRIDE